MTALTIRDAITGEPVAARGLHRHVLLDSGTGADAWLTPTAAVALADALRQAADDVVAAAAAAVTPPAVEQ